MVKVVAVRAMDREQSLSDKHGDESAPGKQLNVLSEVSRGTHLALLGNEPGQSFSNGLTYGNASVKMSRNVHVAALSRSSAEELVSDDRMRLRRSEERR